ncbi:MAG: tail fiber domain-containing protein [Anaerolineae bacterium]
MQKRKSGTRLESATLRAMVGLLAAAILLLMAGTGGASPAARPLAQGGSPLLLNYQGRLLDPATGDPVADGDYEVTFSLYDAETDGTDVYSETQTVRVEEGLFNALLGSSTSLSASDFDGTDRWLELEVDGEPLAPRQRIASAPYAIQAQEAKNAWRLTGNSGTDASVNFLGTTDNEPLELRVNDARALRLEPHTISPNVIGGYSGNDVTSGMYGATIGGGGQSGSANQVTDNYGTVGGGMNNIAKGGGAATVGGGAGNTASGIWATVPGGYDNEADGDDSFAAGRRAKANHDGAFVWADSRKSDFASTTADQFMVRASGGITMYTNSGTSSGAYLAADGSSWNTVSDRARKENFAPVDAQQLLARLAENPITTWNYKTQDPSIRHIGPMAQDFNALIEGLGGEGEKYINALDADGVALAAVQGLYQRSQEQSARIEELEAENGMLKERLDDLEARLTALEAAAK